MIKLIGLRLVTLFICVPMWIRRSDRDDKDLPGKPLEMHCLEVNLVWHIQYL